MNKITAIIVIKDYPKYTFNCLKSVKGLVDEIVIVDIGINPILLKKLKKENKCRIITYKKPVPYVELIREEVKKYAKTNYLFYLDPDEIVPPDLSKLLKENFSKYDSISIPRKNFIFGKWIAHSRWWPDCQVRLFKKNKVFWPKKIHHQPYILGESFSIPAKEKYALIHYNYDSVEDYLSRAIRYARVEVRELIKEKKDYSISTAIKKGISEFVSRFYHSSGYLDGMHGFILSFWQMIYPLLVYSFYWQEKKFKSNIGQDELAKLPETLFMSGLRETNHWLGVKQLGSNIDNLKLKIINRLIEK